MKAQSAHSPLWPCQAPQSDIYLFKGEYAEDDAVRGHSQEHKLKLETLQTRNDQSERLKKEVENDDTQASTLRNNIETNEKALEELRSRTEDLELKVAQMQSTDEEIRVMQTKRDAESMRCNQIIQNLVHGAAALWILMCTLMQLPVALNLHNSTALAQKEQNKPHASIHGCVSCTPKRPKRPADIRVGTCRGRGGPGGR